MKSMNALEFDPDSHTYRYQGRPCPGVTSILEPFSGLEFVHPDVLAAAAAFGTHVHDAVDLFNRGELDEAWLIEESPLVYTYLEHYKQFLHDSGAVVVASEQKVVHPRMRYAGTLDTILNVSKTNRIYDLKTGSGVPRTVGPQVEAYNRAYSELTGSRLMRRYCLHLTEDGYKVHPLTNPSDWDIFRAALTLHRWQSASH